MITFEEAKQIALNYIQSDCALVVDETSEKPYGWYFFYQSKAYLRSGNILDRLIGGGGFIVDKEDDYVFEFGSGYPLHRNLIAYEAGFKCDSYDLTIVSISSFQETLDWLLRLSMPYYGKDNLESVLMSLPYTFFNQVYDFERMNFLQLINRNVVNINSMDGASVNQQSLFGKMRANTACSNCLAARHVSVA